MNQEIFLHFKKNDPILFEYVKRFKEEINLEEEKPSLYFYRLCRAIAYQQLSGKAASVIWGRFESLFGGKEFNPENTLKITHEQMRACGLSNAKANYIRNIATSFSNDANYSGLKHLTNEEVIELLTKIKGIGRWTAEMFLMFTLGREDIFSNGDLALKKGLMKVYSLKKEPSVKTIERLTKKWKPYRTYGAMVLWQILDTKT